MKVLIIDRVKVFQQIIAGVLLDSGIDHIFAATGHDALAALKGDAYQCICVSLYLDDIDGIELCKQIRKLEGYKHTPVVLLTTESDTGTFNRAIQSGITDVFLKDQIHELVNFLERFTQVSQPLEGRVLYIEDQRSQREYISALFRKRSLEVDAYDNIDDAWQAFLQHDYHLVLTDIVLAEATGGILLINKIRRLDGSKGDTPILAITGFDDPARRISLFHMGITDYIIKPIMEEELIARVRNLITNQLALEKERHLRARLSSEELIRHSQKMEALGKLTSGVIHDYNNMLNIVSGYTQVLMEELADQPDLLEYLQQIDRASQSAINLTRKLLMFSRDKHQQLQIINLNEMVEGMTEILQKSLTATIHIDIALQPALWNICSDSNDLENALLNLSINAKHAMEGSGTLSLVTANQSLDLKSSEKLGLPPGDYVLLSVADSGSGMDEKTMGRIFDPFFSTKGESGTGLGLSQVYGLVSRAHGAIKVNSQPGQGTIFNLYFPRVENQASVIEDRGEDHSSAIKYQGATILVVDDQVALSELMEIYLLGAGYEVYIAHSADEALKQLQAQSIDIMITDLIMPGMNGLELATLARQQYPAMKIILATGREDEFDEKAAGEVAYPYQYRLQKPIDREGLLRAIQQV